MLWKRRTPSPATIIATAALVVATTGVAIGQVVAKDGRITACYSKKNGALRVVETGKKCRKNEKQIAWNQRGQRGRRGPAGDDGFDGLDGLDGLDGRDGADAASMLTGSVDAAGSGPVSAFPSGATSAATDAADRVMLSPATETVARDLAVKLHPDVPVPDTATYSFVLRADGVPAVSCSMTGTERSCHSTSATAPATVPAGSELTLEYTQTGGTVADDAPRDFRFGWRATTP